MAFEEPALVVATSSDVTSRDHEPIPATAPRKNFGTAATVREQLRAMMVPATEPEQFNAVLELAPHLTHAEVMRLRDTALTGNAAFFETALADALGIDYAQARGIRRASGYGDLIHALKSLEIPDDTAFVIASANHPASFSHPEAIRIFLERYRLCHPEAAREMVRGWKADSIASVVRSAKPKPTRLQGANSDDQAAARKAS